MPGSHGLAGGTHAHRVTAPQPGQPHFRGRFVVGTGELDIDTFLNLHAASGGAVPDDLPHPRGIHFAHVREAGTQLVDVSADQGTGHGGGDVVGNDYQVTGTELRVAAPCRIGQDQLPRTHQAHQANGQHHIGHEITLIIVDPALHDDHRGSAHIAEDETSPVAADGGNRESGDLIIGNRSHDLNLIGKIAQAGTQHQRHLRLEIRLFLNALHTGHQFFIHGFVLLFLT